MMFPTHNPDVNLKVFKFEIEERVARAHDERLARDAAAIRRRRPRFAAMRHRLGDVLMRAGERLQSRPHAPVDVAQGHR